jgi:sugar phosphate isomerase/epimerase
MRYAICNETFEGWEHARICRFIAELGYTGLEIAPFTLAPRITDVTFQRRKQLRDEAEAAGVQIIGLHWLLAKTEGFQVTAADEATRKRTAKYLVELGRACADLGGDLLIFGSPGQRKIPLGHTHDQAMEFAADTFRRAMPAIADFGVKLCIEPLGPAETEFINTCSAGVQLMEMIDHPNCCLHLDVKAMSTESKPVPDLIRRYGPLAAHFHANDPNKRGPGFGEVDFKPIFAALKEIEYRGWVSVEVFDYTPDAETIARESIRYMRRCANSNGNSSSSR